MLDKDLLAAVHHQIDRINDLLETDPSDAINVLTEMEYVVAWYIYSISSFMEIESEELVLLFCKSIKQNIAWMKLSSDVKAGIHVENAIDKYFKGLADTPEMRDQMVSFIRQKSGEELLESTGIDFEKI